VALIPNYFSSGEEENQMSVNQRQYYPSFSGHKSTQQRNDLIREREFEHVRESETSQHTDSRKNNKKNQKHKQATSSEEEESEEDRHKSKKK
jgi:hypothetical protein